VSAFRISRVTLFSLLFALLLGAWIWRWNVGQSNDCARYLAGDKTFPPSQIVVSGTRTIVVPCEYWLPRQPERVQALCLLDLVLAVVFVMNGLLDLRGWFERRRQRRAMETG
jgi:hypothetical protein